VRGGEKGQGRKVERGRERRTKEGMEERKEGKRRS